MHRRPSPTVCDAVVDADEIRLTVAQAQSHLDELRGAADVAAQELGEAIRMLRGATRSTEQDRPGFVLDIFEGALERINEALGKAELSRQAAAEWAHSL